MEQPHPHPWRAFIVLAVPIFLTVVDLFIVNVALPAVAAEFTAATLSELSWVLTSYAIIFAAALVPAGKLGDLYGRRRLYIGGLATFLVGSVLAAASPSLSLLLAARAVQALGAAAMTPNSLGLMLPQFGPDRRAAAIAAWGAIAGIGAAAGPVLGALLADASWRWIFLVNLPLGALALILVPRIVQEVKDESAARFPDAIGAALLAVAIGLLTLGLSQASLWSRDGRMIASLLAASLIGAAFVWRSSRHPAPVVELSLLRQPAFALAMAGSVLFWAGFAALLVSSALFLTSVWRFSILEAGFGLAPGPALSAVFAGLSGRLTARFGAGRVGGVGGMLLAVAAISLGAQLTERPDYVGAFLPAQLIGGAGIGLAIPSMVAIAVAALPALRLSTGIGVYSMFRQIGAALGVAAWVAAVGTESLGDAASFVPGWAFIAAMSVAASVVLLATVLPGIGQRPRELASAMAGGR
ncbi:MAG TPA: MFS transporter [Candidatus Limnocylindria bacterium]